MARPPLETPTPNAGTKQRRWVPALAAVLGVLLAIPLYLALSSTPPATDKAKALVPLPPKPWLNAIPPRRPADPHPSAELCTQDGILCPDLAMRPPYQLIPDVQGGRRVLRVANAVLSIGPAAVEVRGVRTSKHRMRATQYVHRSRGRAPIAVPGGAGSIVAKQIPRQGRIWKFSNAAKFELWTVGAEPKLARVGPKLVYCLRDLRKLWDWDRSPRREVYPACSNNVNRTQVTLGTSPGWADIYPATYHEQWIDIQGLRGCFDLIHIADPGNRIIETDETNNAAKTRLRLPPTRRGVTRC